MNALDFEYDDEEVIKEDDLEKIDGYIAHCDACQDEGLLLQHAQSFLFEELYGDVYLNEYQRYVYFEEMCSEIKIIQLGDFHVAIHNI